jgi:hypothetical protein
VPCVLEMVVDAPLVLHAQVKLLVHFLQVVLLLLVQLMHPVLLFQADQLVQPLLLLEDVVFELYLLFYLLAGLLLLYLLMEASMLVYIYTDSSPVASAVGGVLVLTCSAFTL